MAVVPFPNFLITVCTHGRIHGRSHPVYPRGTTQPHRLAYFLLRCTRVRAGGMQMPKIVVVVQPWKVMYRGDHSLGRHVDVMGAGA
jgi:hypothetical protein